MRTTEQVKVTWVRHPERDLWTTRTRHPRSGQVYIGAWLPERMAVRMGMKAYSTQGEPRAAARPDVGRDLDARLVSAVRRRLGTDKVSLVEHRPTGRGSQTVPVFDVPQEFRSRAVALGLTVTEGR